MFLRLLILFVTVPLLELYLLLQLAGLTSPGATFLLVIVTGIIGSWLAKREGLAAWGKFHAAMGEGRIPSREIQDGLMIVFAAALLLTPGLITDFVGFTLLMPLGRNLIRRFVLSKVSSGFRVNVQSTTYASQSRSSSQGRPFDEPQFVDPMTVEGKATRKS